MCVVVLVIALAVVIVLLSIWYMLLSDSVAYTRELRRQEELNDSLRVQLEGLSSAAVVSREEFDRLRIEYEAKSRKLAEILSIVNS